MTTTSARSTLGIPQAIAERGFLSVDHAAEARLAGIVATYFDLLWRSLRRFGVPESTLDDAAQHVLMTIADRLPEVEPRRERAFLLATAFRVAANVRRGIGRSPELPAEELEQWSSRDPTPEALLEEKRRRMVLDQALATLPLDQRAVFVLFELEGFTLPEIAETLGIALGTVSSRLRRARGRFEAWVKARHARGESPCQS
jgi:RNA polymerase sigma-70 factor (ECF subfamily)